MPVNKNIDKRNSNIKIYINGSFFDRDDAKISVFDSGFLLGDGIWEGIRLVNNEWMFLDEHLDRLFEGCKAIDININLSKEEIKEAIIETQKINNMNNSAHARLMITRGNKIKPFQQPSLSDGINFVIIMEHSEAGSIKDGINLITVPQVRGLPMSQDPKLNSHSKLNCILACIQANKAGGDEALMLDPYGFVNTTNSCNFFIVKNNEVWTSTGDYCMNGITRLKVIELCKANDIPVFEKNFSLVDVYSSQEAFITGTLGSLTQVLTIDGRSIGESKNGWPISNMLRELYTNLLNV
jgi:branched-chain amino acid aminotransferase